MVLVAVGQCSTAKSDLLDVDKRIAHVGEENVPAAPCLELLPEDAKENMERRLASTPNKKKLTKLSTKNMSPFSPKTRKYLSRINVDPDRLLEATIIHLTSPSKREKKTPHLHTVRDEEIFNQVLRKEIFLTPSIRHALSRRPIRGSFPQEIIVHGEARPILAYRTKMSRPSEPVETPEEATQRKIEQALLLKKAKKRHERFLSSSVDTKEYQMLILFSNYLEKRKKCPGTMRHAEVEDILDDILPAFGYERLDTCGYVLWFARHSLDLDKEDDMGETNMDRLARFISPVGLDKKSMHLHHATKYDAMTHGTTSYLILMTETYHASTFNKALHFKSQAYWKPQKAVDRSLFDPKRPKIFKALKQHLDTGSVTSSEGS